MVGVVTALITKFTKEVKAVTETNHFSCSKVRVVEPLAVLSCAYLSYMLAELVSFSGGLSTIFDAFLHQTILKPIFTFFVTPLARDNITDWMRNCASALCLQEYIRQVGDNHQILHCNAEVCTDVGTFGSNYTNKNCF